MRDARMEREELTRRVVGAAAALGFDRCAVAPVERIAAAVRLEEWLAAGMHGSMEWMARNAARRRDPTRVVAGARSVVVVAINYHSDEPAALDPTTGRISRYAWGDEYHRVVGARLERLWGEIRGLCPETEGRWYVDTGPVLEKAWAERAGLGWIGKHTNLIHRDLGSWIFLGAIVLDVELDYGRPHRDYCGTCAACIEACPTDAIVAPYLLDARRCISYLTIENRGPIPTEFRRPLGNRIFGCDDCQDVCPWNRFAQLSRQAARFASREENRTPDLIDLLRLDEEGFRRRFRHSPVRRAKWRGFLRNVAVALGNSGERSAVGPLLEALAHVEPLVRGHAAWALGELGGDEAMAGLEARRRSEPDGWVGAEIDAALASLCGQTAGKS